MSIGEIFLNLALGLISGGITSIVVTKYFKDKEERENKIREQKERKELQRKQIREEYIEFKQYLHEFKLYLNNIFSVWDVIKTGESTNTNETKESLNQLIRYLSGQPYNVTKDLQIIKLDSSSRQHLDNIDESISELMDFASETLADDMNLDQEKLVEKILYLSIAMGKTRVTNIEGNIVTCDFY